MELKTIKYQNRMTDKDKQKILELHSIGASNIDISKIIGCSNTAIRVFLKKNNLQSNVPKRDRSRPCKVCGTTFTPKCNDGFKKEKYRTCSPKCTSTAISQSKIKYTEDDIQSVIKLKKDLLTNGEIVEITKVDINKVKEITQTHSLQLSPEQRQTNAYNKKLEKNPNCMENMRDTRLKCPTNEFNKKLSKIVKVLSDPNNKLGIPHLSKKEGLCDVSVRRSLHLRELGNLIEISKKLRPLNNHPPKPIKEVKKLVKERGFVLIEKSYAVANKPMKVECDKCEKIRETNLYNILKNDCPFCSNTGTSKAECEVFDFIKEYLPNIEIQQSNRTILKPKEIDIYLPSLKLGIEYCGLHWHHELSPQSRDKNYHYNKMIEANKQGIRLITIFEDEWRDKQFQVQSYLKSVLNITNKRIFARKCNIQEVDSKKAKDFLEKYHIQGKTMSQVALGLYYDNELLGLITGNVHHRQKGDNPPFVLNRLVFKEGVQIVGGTSKLLKHLIDYAKKEGYLSLISWSDNRWSEGDVYGKCGFTLESNLKPDYSYVIGETGTRQSKQSNKKKCLLKKGAIGTMNNTERELALTMNLFRIWDCGKKRWTLSLIS